jgi:NAD+ kinase
MSSRPASVTVLTRRTPSQTAEALRRVVDLALAEGVEVRIPPEEVEKHRLEPRDGVKLGAEPTEDTDLALVLGGDGTILSTLRMYAGRDVPVFAINYGAIGFLSTVEHDDLEGGVRQALAGEFDVMALPALTVQPEERSYLAVNDISFHRRPEGRVAELSYSVEGEQLGSVRCDGLVVSTPAGSTGYNLANGGPVLAWGVEGYVVSFIAPHTLTARALVVAPGSALEVTNRSPDEPADMTTDGRGVGALAPQASVTIRFGEQHTLLAQSPGATFYGRLRQKFGRLSF